MYQLTKIPISSPTIFGNLYRSAIPDVKCVPFFKENGITHIVQLIDSDNLKQVYEKGGFQVIYFPIPDMETPRFYKIVPLVNQIKDLLQQGHSVLIHCFGGMGRTGTVMACVVGDLMGMKADETITYLRQYYYAVETYGQRTLVETYLDLPKYSYKYLKIPIPSMTGKVYCSILPFNMDINTILEDIKNKNISTILVLCPTSECHERTGMNLKTEYKERGGLKVLSLSINMEQNVWSGFYLNNDENYNNPSNIFIDAIRKTITETIDILKNGENVLIQCGDGLNRTGMILACLIGTISHLSTKESLDYIRKYMPDMMTSHETLFCKKRDMMQVIDTVLSIYQPPKLNKTLTQDIIKAAFQKELKKSESYKITNHQYYMDHLDTYIDHLKSIN